jgi:hypothetical protein
VFCEPRRRAVVAGCCNGARGRASGSSACSPATG